LFLIIINRHIARRSFGWKGIKTFAALMEALGAYCEVTYIKQIGYGGIFSRNNVDYVFLRSNKRKPYFPRQVNNAVKELSPDIVIVSGIRSPLQILQLRRRLGRKLLSSAGIITTGRRVASGGPFSDWQRNALTHIYSHQLEMRRSGLMQE